MENFSDDTIHKSKRTTEEHFQKEKDNKYIQLNEDEYQLFNKDFKSSPCLF